MQKIRIGLSARLLELRGNMSQSAFSKNLGILQQTYARWELGDRQPKLQDLASLASHFGVTTDWLLGLSDSKGNNPTLPQNGVRQRVAALKHNANQVAEKANELLTAITELEQSI